MRNLGFLDTWRSSILIVLAIVMVIAPIMSLLVGFISIPSFIDVKGSKIESPIPVSLEEIPGVTLVGESSSLSHDQNASETSILDSISTRELSLICLVNFVIAGLAVIISVARPLEQRYFFIELTFAPSRRRLLFYRVCLVLSMLAVATVSESIVINSISYVVYGERAWTMHVFLYTLASLFMTVLSASLISGLISILSKNTSIGSLSILSFVTLIEIVSLVWNDKARVIVRGVEVLRTMEGGLIYVSLMLVLLTLVAFIGDRVEY